MTTPLQGTTVELTPVLPAEAAKIAPDFAKPEGQRALRRPDKVFTAKELEDRLTKGMLHLWHVVADGKTLGYAGYRQYGRSYLLFYPIGAAYSVDVLQELTPLLFKHFYEHGRAKLYKPSQEAPLNVYLPRNLEDDMHGFLLEQGFDPQEEYMFADYGQELCYELQPETYAAYHGDEAGAAP